MKRKIVVAVMVVAGLAALSLTGCVSPNSILGGILGCKAVHEVSLTCTSPTPGSLHCKVQTQGINAIESLLFWSEQTGEPLWAITIAPTAVEPKDLAEIVYGVLPDVPDEPQLRRVRQAFPAEGKPRQIAPGERFFVSVVYQYDEPLTPCGGKKSFGFEVQKDGSIQALPACDHVDLPPAVEKLEIKMSGPESVE